MKRKSFVVSLLAVLLISCMFLAACTVKHTVTYELNGGTATFALTEEVKDGETVSKPSPNPTKDGYTFKFWTDTQNGTVEYTWTNAVTGDLKLYAVWEQIPATVYTVTFNLNGGTGTAPTVQSINEGGKATAPTAPTRTDGYTFRFWATSATGTTAYDFDTVLTGNLTLYAIWQAPVATVYTVTFNENYGTTPATTVADAVDGKAVAPATAPTRTDGYTFKFWATTTDGTTAYDFDTVLTANLVLYAIWEEDAPVVTTYTVTFDLDGGTGEFPTTQTIDDGDVAEAPTTAPTKANHRFSHWVLDGETTAYNFETPVTANITLVAIWIQQFSVTFDLGYTDATGEPNVQIVDNGDYATDPELDHLRIGFEFVRWVLDGETTEYVFTTTPVTANITLVAIWVAAVRTVTFDLGYTGATGEPAEQSVDNGDYAIDPDTTYTRTGFRFLHWALDGETTAYNFEETRVMANITLVAIWIQQFSVTFDLDGGTGEFPTTQTIDDGDVATPTTAPAKAGNRFVHWVLSGSTTAYNFETPVTTNITLVAIWVVTYTVTFDYNYTDAPAGSAMQITTGSKVNTPTETPTRTNYTFVCWSTNKDATAIASAYDFDTLVTANLNLYAIWALIKYQVTFSFNGDSTDPVVGTLPAAQAVNSGDLATAPTETAPTRTNYTFKFWAASAISSTGFDFATTTITSNLTLYAVWQGDESSNWSTLAGTWRLTRVTTTTIVVDADNKTVKVYDNTSSKYGTITARYEYPGVLALTTTHDFWGNAVTTNPKYERIISLQLVGNNLKVISTNCPDRIFADDIFYPIVNVSYNLAGGTGTFAALTIEKGTSTSKPATEPALLGYKFLYWASSADGTSEYGWSEPVTTALTLYAVWAFDWKLLSGTYYNEDDEVTLVINADASGVFAGVATVEFTFDGTYVVCAVLGYSFTYGVTAGTLIDKDDTSVAFTKQQTLTFDTDGGTYASLTALRGTAFTDPSTVAGYVVPTKDNYTFLYWANANTPTVAYVWTTLATADITLIAVWQDHRALVEGRWAGQDENDEWVVLAIEYENGAATFNIEGGDTGTVTFNGTTYAFDDGDSGFTMILQSNGRLVFENGNYADVNLFKAARVTTIYYNGTTTITEISYITKGEVLTKPIATPEQESHIFLYWASSDDQYSLQYTFGGILTDDVSLTAVFRNPIAYIQHTYQGTIGTNAIELAINGTSFTLNDNITGTVSYNYTKNVYEFKVTASTDAQFEVDDIFTMTANAFNQLTIVFTSGEYSSTTYTGVMSEVVGSWRVVTPWPTNPGAYVRMFTITINSQKVAEVSHAYVYHSGNSSFGGVVNSSSYTVQGATFDGEYLDILTSAGILKLRLSGDGDSFEIIYTNIDTLKDFYTTAQCNSFKRIASLTYDLDGGSLYDEYGADSKIFNSINVDIGSVLSTAMRYYYNINVTDATPFYVKPDGDPTKIGYTFKHWAVKGGDLSVAYDWNSAVTGDISLIAVWEANPNDPILALNGGWLGTEQYYDAIYLVIDNGSFTLKWISPSTTGFTMTTTGTSTGKVFLYDATTGVFRLRYNSSIIGNFIVSGNTLSLTTSDSLPSGASRTFAVSLAKQADNNKVRFYLNGGSGTPPATQSVAIGEKATIPATPIRDGYVLRYWSTSADGTDEYNWDSIITGYTVLYAIWGTAQVTVTFNLNGATGTAPTAQILSNGGKATKPNTDPTKDNHKFLYWATSATGTVGYDWDKGVTGNMTLYAIWEVTIIPEGFASIQGGWKGTYAPNWMVSFTVSLTISASDFIYTLSYYTSMSGATSVVAEYTGSITLAEGTYTLTSGTTAVGNFTVTTAGLVFNNKAYQTFNDCTLASTVTKYTVAFNSNGGTGGTVPASQSIKTGETALEPAVSGLTITKTNYVFSYWSLTKDGAAYDWSTPVTKGITLYAIWTVDPAATTRTVTFDQNYTGAPTSNRTIVDGETIAKPSNPTRSGYVFLYWSSTTNGTAYDWTATVTADKTLYAIWTDVFEPVQGTWDCSWTHAWWTDMNVVLTITDTGFTARASFSGNSNTFTGTVTLDEGVYTLTTTILITTVVNGEDVTSYLVLGTLSFVEDELVFDATYYDNEFPLTLRVE